MADDFLYKKEDVDVIC